MNLEQPITIGSIPAQISLVKVKLLRITELKDLIGQLNNWGPRRPIIEAIFF